MSGRKSRRRAAKRAASDKGERLDGVRDTPGREAVRVACCSMGDVLLTKPGYELRATSQSAERSLCKRTIMKYNTTWPIIHSDPTYFGSLLLPPDNNVCVPFNYVLLWVEPPFHIFCFILSFIYKLRDQTKFSFLNTRIYFISNNIDQLVNFFLIYRINDWLK